MLINEKKVYSRNGEDGIIQSIFETIGTSNRFYVEIGCENATECNTRKLSEIDGWSGIRINNNHSDPGGRLFQHYVTPENVVDILRQHEVPEQPDLFSIDVDFSDFHVLNATLRCFRPRVIVSEYNASLGPSADQVVPYLRGVGWDRTDYFGASYTAFLRLGAFFGYRVVHCDAQGVNIFLVRDDLLVGTDADSARSTYRPPGYRGGMGHPPDTQRRPYLRSENYLLSGTATAETPFGFITYFRNDQYIGHAFASGGYWERPIVTEVAKRLADSQGLVLDIGAHIGSHSVALARMNPHLSFVCFEPQRSLFLLLERNVAENRLSNRFELHNAAVSSVAGQITLSSTVHVEESGERRAVEYGGTLAVNLGGVQLGGDGQACEAVCIDDRVWPRTVYVKVDVEGAEPLAFYGMQSLLRRNLPHILFEDREDRRLDAATLDRMGVPAYVRDFSPRGLLESLGYGIERLGLDFIARPPASRVAALGPTGAEDRIPARIFQTWKSKQDIPANYAFWSATFSEHNPQFARVLWDDDDNRRFIAETFPWFLETYDSYPREIYRADAVRYFYLYAFGGIYADMDVECLRPLDGLLDRGDVVLGRMGSDPDHPHSIPNAIMASKPREEFWLLAMWLLREMSGHVSDPEHTTGPVLLKSAVDLYLARDPLWVRKVIRDTAGTMPEALHPAPRRSRVTLLGNRDWFAVDWTDPVHQLLRQDILRGGGLLSDARKRALFQHAWMVTYWTHNW